MSELPEWARPRELPAGWGSVWDGAAYCTGCRIFLRAAPVRYVMTGFEHFDRLVDEDFKPRLREKMSLKAWREHVFIGRS